MHKAVMVLAVIGIGGALVAAGCGGDDDDTTTAALSKCQDNRGRERGA